MTNINTEIFVYITNEEVDPAAWSTFVKINDTYIPINVELSHKTLSRDVALKHAKTFWHHFFVTLSKSIEV